MPQGIMSQMDFTPMLLASAKIELALMRQKLAMRRMAFIFELQLMKAQHNAYLEKLSIRRKNIASNRRAS